MIERLRHSQADLRIWVFALILILVAFGVSHDVAMNHGVGSQGDSHTAEDFASDSLVHAASALCAAVVVAGLFVLTVKALRRTRDRWPIQISRHLRSRTAKSYSPPKGRHLLFELCVLRA